MSQRIISRRSFFRTAAAGAALTGVSANVLSKTGTPDQKNRYLPTWESLDSHPCPEWYEDAKLGMYFHWGLSSVPGWAPRKNGTPYAEWYWNSMRDEKNPTWKYHRDTYGEYFAYDDFIPLFRAERYHPEEWAAFAKNTGMKYVFMNTKHHDGFCLWPSRVTNRNTYKMGPKRDLIGPFVRAARKEGLKVGFYYSFYEWYNPLYTGNPQPYAGYIPHKNYVEDFMAPQVRELIDLYQPDFLYFDGEWDQPPEFWKSPEFVADYYNQALKRKQDVLVNDRFGKGSRGTHGDVFNVEYEYGIESQGLLTHKWSYWRGIAKTFGYNRDADPQDCLSAQELIHMVVDGVSRNGNFDINIGPTGAGEIIDIERAPLEALGKWLRINGEAIYGSRIWKIPAEGDIRFTAKGEYVYALVLKWPGKKFDIRSIRAEEGSKISMLGAPGSISWSQNSDALTLEYPLWKSRPIECAYAWVFKIRAKKTS
ncbi:MAG: alpha-L-fucosidase [Candidatus Latescibacterota bacterium]